MAKVLIIEDETQARQALVKLVQFTHPSLEIVGQTESIQQSLHFLKNNSIDIALVDIELSDGTSFEIFKTLKTINFKIIFTTAFNQYAIKAFKVNALDYLLKPIDPEELKHAIDKAIKELTYDTNYKKLLEISAQKEDQKMVLKTTKQNYIVKITDIILIEAQGAYTKFITKTQSILVSKHLRYYESILLDFNFIRPHNSYLINPKEVHQLHTNKLIMSNTFEVPIATRKRSEIHKILTKF